MVVSVFLMVDKERPAGGGNHSDRTRPTAASQVDGADLIPVPLQCNVLNSDNLLPKPIGIRAGVLCGELQTICERAVEHERGSPLDQAL